MTPKLRGYATRRFVDEFTRLRVCRYRALGIVDPAKNYAQIEVDGKTKLIYTAHTQLKWGGGFSYFVCPNCGKWAQNLYLVDDAPLCRRCCQQRNIWFRSQYGTRGERLDARERKLDELLAKLEAGERIRVKALPKVWCGKLLAQGRMTMRARRNQIALRLNQLASTNTAVMRPEAFAPIKDAKVFDMQPIWRARTTEELQQALDQAQSIMLEALHGNDKQKRLAAARILIRTKYGRQLGFGL
jgi:hypothetical protein